MLPQQKQEEKLLIGDTCPGENSWRELSSNFSNFLSLSVDTPEDVRMEVCPTEHEGLNNETISTVYYAAPQRKPTDACDFQFTGWEHLIWHCFTAIEPNVTTAVT